MKKIIVSAPGKIHLLGEHAIVYGKPAIITSVDKRCIVSILPNNSPVIKITSQQLNKTIEVSINDVLAKQQKAQEKWQEYIKNNNISVLKSITENDLDFVVIAIGETLKYLNKKLTSGFDLEINSEIPIGAGLGSSAAVSVSTIGAVFLLLGEKLDKEKINEIAFLTEQKRHGLPSGGDNSTVTYGGLVWYRKESPEIKIIKPIPFSVSNDLAKNFVLIDTGRPSESTGEMVGLVRNLLNKRPKWTEDVFNNQEKQVRIMLQAIKDNNESLLTTTIKTGERNLEKIGVVSNFSHDLIRDIEKLGGVAKICGAGGKTGKTGVVLAYHQNPETIVKLVKSAKLVYFKTKLGAEGVRVEND